MSTPTSTPNPLVLPDIKVFLRYTWLVYAMLVVMLCVLLVQTVFGLMAVPPILFPKELPTVIQSICGLFALGQLLYFLKWYYNSYQLLQKAQVPGLVFNPILGIFIIFVPLVNLVVPYLTWIELYKASYPNPPEGDWKKVPIPWFLITRWALDILHLLVVFGFVIAGMGLAMSSPNNEPPENLMADVKLISEWTGWVFLAALTWLSVKFVKTTLAHQREKFFSGNSLPAFDPLQDWPQSSPTQS